MRVLDLFCGAGGFAQGFTEAGFKVKGVDISENVGMTYESNCKAEFVKADLSKVMIRNGDYDIIIGGPPCKPWSAVNVTKRGKAHSDYHLVSQFFRHVKHHCPKIFVLENVPLLANDETVGRSTRTLGRRGYSILGQVVKYSDFGAPTRRHRFILVGVMKGNARMFFDRLTEHRRSPKTVKDVIWKLRNKKKGEVIDHVWPELKTISKYRSYYESGKFGWYVLKWDEPAPSFGNIMKTYILHPDAFNGRPPRVISVREASLIMGFDQGFSFPVGFGLGLRYQMIVDAVSPIFSYAVAEVVKETFS